MKTIFLLLIVTRVGYSQVSNDRQTIQRKDTTGIYSQLLSARTYTASTLDTSIAYATSDYKNTYVTVQSKDSARCHVKYQLSVDGTTWGVSATKDSLSTTTDGGDLKSMDFTAQILGSPYVRYIFDFTVSGVPQGTTTNTYTAILTRRQD